MPLTARDAVLKALSSYRRSKIRPGDTLDDIIVKEKLSSRDAALSLRIMNGVLQNMILLDFYIASFSTVNLNKIEPQALDILRIAIYQIVFLTKVPSRAAVNEGVAAAKKRLNPRAVGFINAVLRRAAVSAETGDLPIISSQSESKRLSVTYSHPEWLVNEFCRILDNVGAEELLIANNNPETPVTVQVNTLKTTTDAVLTELSPLGVDVQKHPLLKGCLELHGAGNIRGLNVFNRGEIYVQDAASKMAVIASGVKSGDFLIDGCSAPGGKSFAAAIKMQNTGRILSCDVYERKLSRIDDSAKRLGIDIIDAQVMDASLFNADLCGKADVVIADVPCSGFGVIRKKPEIRFKCKEEISGLPDLQLSILSNLSTYVKPGGTIIYSTCTVLPNENEEVIKRFLNTNDNYTIADVELPGIPAGKGMITLLPHVHKTDGFFICKLKRRKL